MAHLGALSSAGLTCNSQGLACEHRRTVREGLSLSNTPPWGSLTLSQPIDPNQPPQQGAGQPPDGQQSFGPPHPQQSYGTPYPQQPFGPPYVQQPYATPNPQHPYGQPYPHHVIVQTMPVPFHQRVGVNLLLLVVTCFAWAWVWIGMAVYAKYKGKGLAIYGGAVAVLVLISAVAGAGGSGTNTTIDTASDARDEPSLSVKPAEGPIVNTGPTEDKSARVEPTEETEAAPVALGKPARDGEFEFVVKKVECGETRVGDQYFNATAQGQFCMVHMSITNIGEVPQSMFGDNQKLFDSRGREFSASTEAAIYLDQGDKTLWEEINPGNTVSGIVVFDVPKKARPVVLELHDSAFSGGVRASAR